MLKLFFYNRFVIFCKVFFKLFLYYLVFLISNLWLFFFNKYFLEICINNVKCMFISNIILDIKKMLLFYNFILDIFM